MVLKDNLPGVTDEANFAASCYSLTRPLVTSVWIINPVNRPVKICAATDEVLKPYEITSLVVSVA
jgi:hypothetical protein